MVCDLTSNLNNLKMMMLWVRVSFCSLCCKIGRPCKSKETMENKPRVKVTCFFFVSIVAIS